MISDSSCICTATSPEYAGSSAGGGEKNTTKTDRMTHCGLQSVCMPDATRKTLLLNSLLDRRTYAHEDERGLQVLLVNPATLTPTVHMDLQ